jgi:tetratricopeptide (TPR) repeat protein
MPGITRSDAAGRSPAAQLRALGHQPPRAPVEDSPRWHLTAAEEAMDAGDWDVARGAIDRARESIAPGSADADEACYAALRLALATVDLRLATAEVMALADRMDPLDPVWNRRVRRVVESAPAVFSPSMRVRLLELLPAVPPPATIPGEEPYLGEFVVPADGLPPLPDEEPWDPAAGPALLQDASGASFRPVPTESPFGAGRVRPEPQQPPDDVLVFDEDALPPAATPAGFAGRVRIVASESDLSDADLLRERLVEEMLASVTEDEGQLLFATASTFLNNGQFQSAEIMFSAAMQIPDLRLAACEGLMQALVAAGRHAEAVATAVRAERIFVRDAEALLGIVYWHGVAAQALGDTSAARTCFARVLAHPAHVHFPEVAARAETVTG